MSPYLLLIALIGAHYVADFCLQDFLYRAKDPVRPISGVPWYQGMIAHTFIHGAAVSLITNIWWLFIPEFFIHFYLDYSKCKNKISFNTDQVAHLGCKVVWWIIAINVLCL